MRNRDYKQIYTNGLKTNADIDVVYSIKFYIKTKLLDNTSVYIIDVFAIY